MRKALGMVFLWGLVAAAAPWVILNEFGQGRAGLGEWVELLVVGEGPGTFVDLRGWSLQDAQGDSRGGVFIKFKENEFWAKVPAGTLIVIYNAADAPNLPAHFPKDDLDPADFLLVIPGKTGDYLEVLRWEGLANSGDCVYIVNSRGEVVFRLSYGKRQCGGVQLGNVDRGQAAWFLAGSLEGVLIPANWKVGPDAPGSSTPGGANSEENAAWVNYLRTPPEK